MPLPVIGIVAGIASLIVGVAQSFVAFFAARFAVKTSIILGYLSTITAISVGFAGALWLLISGLEYVLLPAEVVNFVADLLPLNTIPCMTIVAACKLYSWAYKTVFHAVGVMAQAG